MAIQTINALVVGGKATAGPPLGPALGPLKLNVKKVIDDINKKTESYSGMTVPITLKVDPSTKEYEIVVSTPQTSVLLYKEANAEKGSSTAGTETVGDINLDSVIKISKMKEDVLLSSNLKNAVKEVLGTAISCGITVEGKHPRDVQKEIDQGLHDKILN
ncbi:MAG: 50S ribosomal protein L11 [Candidatus Hodarchaeales archaeon]|jgi:large subunit ribosomal protein L11